MIVCKNKKNGQKATGNRKKGKRTGKRQKARGLRQEEPIDPELSHDPPGLFHFPICEVAAAVIGKPLGIQPAFGKAVHLPRLAEKAAGSAVLRSPTLVMCHSLEVV